MQASLDTILNQTRLRLPDLAARRRELERAAADTVPPPPFRAALVRHTVALIGEVKRRSPSAGAIQEDLNPADRAASYVGGGAAAISVLTDGPFFGGSLDDLRAVVRRVGERGIPVLRKDFILSEEQLLEARAAGAAAALLIVRALGRDRLAELLRFSRQTGLDALVEVHDGPELDIALETGADVIGVNSRDLGTFQIDVASAWELLSRVPATSVAIAESGMTSRADVERAAEAGADAVLIGTALSSAQDPLALATDFSQVPRRAR